VGVPMVYTLAEAAKEWMQDRNEKSKGDGSAFERMQQRKREAERAKEKEQEKIDQRRQKKNEVRFETNERILSAHDRTKRIALTLNFFLFLAPLAT